VVTLCDVGVARSARRTHWFQYNSTFDAFATRQPNL
jgi:hypothetical protein